LFCSPRLLALPALLCQPCLLNEIPIIKVLLLLVPTCSEASNLRRPQNEPALQVSCHAF
jgi:hypothetical protein